VSAMTDERGVADNRNSGLIGEEVERVVDDGCRQRYDMGIYRRIIGEVCSEHKWRPV
jgi:hypothetical protein